MTKWWGLVVAVLVAMSMKGASDANASPRPTRDELVFAHSDGTVLQMNLLTLGNPSDRVAAIDAIREATLRDNPDLTDQSAHAGGGWVEKGYAWPAGPVTFHYNPAGAPANLSGADAAIAAAALTWNNAGAAFSFSDAGASSADIGACGVVSDGQNTIGWAPLNGSLLAVTCTLYRQDGPAPHQATEFDMQLDPKWDWTTTSSPIIDVQSAVTHELGHALGLGHSLDPATVMFAEGSSEVLKRDLAPTDIAGAVAIYGAKAAVAASEGQVPLFAGANLIAWPGATGAATSVLAGSQVTAIYSFDAASNSWLRFVPGLSPNLNTMREIVHGQRYWVIVSTDGALEAL